jgi:hypothetical protein
MRYSKIVIPAALIALVVTAFVGVASASAFTKFRVESASTTKPATLKGEQTEPAEFTTDAGTITCSTGSFEGKTTTTESPTQEMSLKYGGCKFLEFINVEVKPNGCSYNFHASGSVDVVGSSCTGITFEAASCKVTVPAQNGLTTIGYANQGSGTTRTIKVSPAVSGIKYNTSAGCLNGAHTGLTDGKYTHGATTVKAFTSAGVQEGTWVE